MYCLSDMCYVCLEKNDKSLININSSLSVNEDIMHIISDLPCNLGWMKTKQIVLLCKQCYRRLRETYQFLTMCDKNSAVLRGYMAEINISNSDNEAELRVDLNNKHNDINETKCEIKLENEEEIYTFISGPIVEESQEVFVNVDDSLVKEEDSWKSEEVAGEEEPPMENNSTDGSDNKMEIAVNSNTHDTDTASASSGSTSTQGHTTNKKKLKRPAKRSYKCLTCSKSFSWKSKLQTHTRVHTGERPYKCDTCEKCFAQKGDLVRHTRIHTGEKPFKCTVCDKRFTDRSSCLIHMRTHPGETPYKCLNCDKCFGSRARLGQHACVKPFECYRCKKRCSGYLDLMYHIRIHSAEKLFQCSRCEKCFKTSSSLYAHALKHTGDEFNSCLIENKTE